MKIDSHNYALMRSWLTIVSPRVFPDIKPEHDPIRVLDTMEAVSKKNARAGLTMAVGDIVEMTSHWSAEQITALDAELQAADVPSFSSIRLIFSRNVQKIVRRGRIRSDIEYHAIRNVVEIFPDQSASLHDLLEGWENSVGR